MIVDIGDKWDAIVFESEQEYYFIQENLRPYQDQEYFVNGSFRFEGYGLFAGFQGYIPRQTGNNSDLQQEGNIVIDHTYWKILKSYPEEYSSVY